MVFVRWTYLKQETDYFQVALSGVNTFILFLIIRTKYGKRKTNKYDNNLYVRFLNFS